MKYPEKLFFAFTLLLLFSHSTGAQNKKNTVTPKTGTKFTERGFGNPQSLSDVKDVLENNEAYNALKSLIEDHHVTSFTQTILFLEMQI